MKKNCDSPIPGIRPRIRLPWERERVGTTNTEPSRTDQSHGDQTNINNIVARFQRTGHLPAASRVGRFEDVTSLQGDLTELYCAARDTVAAAESFIAQWKPKEPAVAPDPASVTPLAGSTAVSPSP